MSFEFLTTLRTFTRNRIEPGESTSPVRSSSVKSALRLTPFGPVRCHVAGEGAPILFVPGLWGGSELFHPTISELAKTSRVYWFDWPGDGGSGESGGTRNVFRPQTILEEAIRATGERNLTILAHSFGAWVALATMSQGSIPQTDRLILAGAGLCDAHRPADVFLRNLRNRKRFDSADPMLAALAKSVLGSDGANATVYRQTLVSLSRTLPAALERRTLWMNDAKTSHEFHDFAVPVTFLACERDAVVPMHSQLRLAESLGADVAAITGPGHLGMTTHPAEFAQAIRRIVRRRIDSPRRRVVSE